MNPKRITRLMQEFLRLESASGLILIAMLVLAMLLANSPLADWYNALLGTPMSIRVGALEIAKPLLLWINDGLMAVFFLLIGLEVKREMIEGQLSSRSQLALPGLAALGGLVLPALIYVWINRGDADALNGWAVPAATDIAFALGILSLAGQRVPVSLKLFLTTLAILDDLAAILIIAIFYSTDLSLISLLLAVVMLAVLFVLNRLDVMRLGAYIVVGVILWVLVLKSGVHATLAGVALAFAIPLRVEKKEMPSPLLHLEHMLHPWVAFGIMPVFAFANAGVSLAGITLSTLLSPVPLGIALGLFVGKQVGVFGFSWLSIKMGLARLPDNSSWWQLYGTAVLCGIGFTMSLFIGSLAFEHRGLDYASAARLGILVGSLLSAVTGYAILRAVGPNRTMQSKGTRKN